MTEDEKKMQMILDHLQETIDSVERFEKRKLTTVETIALVYFKLRDLEVNG